ncbi:MAG: gamma-glutamyl-gamma-aminobutyrate hydrolase family protein [Pseudomonadota bacterium]
MNPILPVIGITCHLALQKSPSGHIHGFHRVAAQYSRAILDAGGIPVIVGTAHGSTPAPPDMLTALDGLLLSGGTDLPSGSFGTGSCPTLRETDPVRYDYEVELVRKAHGAGMPIMGICRGHQTLAESLGGRLILNIKEHDPNHFNHYQTDLPDSTSHDVVVPQGTRMHRWLGGAIRVNSFHRQAVARPPEGFTVSAVSEDHLIEAIEAEAPFALGVQFHPEWLYTQHREFLSLFQAFIRAASDYSKVRRRHG